MIAPNGHSMRSKHIIFPAALMLLTACTYRVRPVRDLESLNQKDTVLIAHPIFSTETYNYPDFGKKFLGTDYDYERLADSLFMNGTDQSFNVLNT